MGRRRRILPVSTVLALLAALTIDRLSKIWVARNLALEVPWAPISSLEKWFSFTYIHNAGAAFGMLPQGGAIFAVVAVMVVSGLVLWYDKLPVHHLAVRIAVGLIIGGALGNLIDRIATGYVVDFLDFKFWPIFNLADSSVVVGVVILGAYMLLGEELAAQTGPGPGHPPPSEPVGQKQSRGV